MTGLTDATLSGLPDSVSQLLANAPIDEKKLLELRLIWDDLPPGNARVAETLRVFVLTWDPLEVEASRPSAFAAVNAELPEVVLYIPLWSLASLAVGRTVTSVLGDLAGRLIISAWMNQLTGESSAADLLESVDTDDEPDGPFGVPAKITAVEGHWEDIGLGAITDIVKHRYGPVDLDRSPVKLGPVAVKRPGCPACAGERFAFIAGLAEAQESMCAPHRREALTVQRKRLARAEASNPDGWAAIVDASSRLSRSHLPDGVLSQLADIETLLNDRSDHLDRDVLAARVRLLIETAHGFQNRVSDFAAALGDYDLPDWLMCLVPNLGHVGLAAEAVLVADALTSVDPSREAFFAGDAGFALADAAAALADPSLAAEARAKVEANLTRWPDDFWIRMHAGDALELLGDREGALAHFETARQLAVASKSFEDRRTVAERIRAIDGSAARAEKVTVMRQQQRGKKSKSTRRR
jgi:hypothetical protein